MIDFLRIVGEKLINLADAASALRQSHERQENYFNEQMRNEARMDSRYEAFVEKADQIVRAIQDPAVLCGVTIRPVTTTNEAVIGTIPNEESAGRVVMGGQAALLSKGMQRRFTFDSYAPMKSFTLKAWGGCVITDVLIGNQSQLISHHNESGISEGTFGSVGVGTRISVVVKIPIREA